HISNLPRRIDISVRLGFYLEEAMNPYQSEREIESVVRGFESCETGKDEFKHRHHLVVAVWYLRTLSREAAVDRMRSSLLRFLDHHGVDRKKYDETITVF